MTYLGLFLNWLATHLVVLALFVFLLLGIYFREPLLLSTVEPADRTATSEPGTFASPPTEQQVVAASPTGGEIGHTADGSDKHEPSAEAISSPMKPQDSGLKNPVFRPTRAGSTPFVPKQEDGNIRFRDTAHELAANRREAEKKTQKRLAAGRDAFAREDFVSAERHYLRYLSERPEDPEAFAELGNLYRVMGRREDALDAYFEAALRFRDLDEWGEVRQLGGILDRAGDGRAVHLLGLPR